MSVLGLPRPGVPPGSIAAVRRTTEALAVLFLGCPRYASISYLQAGITYCATYARSLVPLSCLDTYHLVLRYHRLLLPCLDATKLIRLVALASIVLLFRCVFSPRRLLA